MFYVEKDAQLSLEMERNQNEIVILKEQVGSLQADLNTTKVFENHFLILSSLYLKSYSDVNDWYAWFPLGKVG